MKKLLIIILLFGGSLPLVFSQQNTKSNFSLDYGPLYMMRQNTSISSLIYKDWSGINGRLSYWHEGKFIHGSHVRMTNSKVFIAEPFEFYRNSVNEEPLEKFKHSFTSLDFAYWFGKELYTSTYIDFLGGFREMNNLQIGDYANVGDTNFGYNFTFTLDSWVQTRINLNEKHALNSKLAFQILGFQARSPYLGQNAEYFENTKSRKPLLTVIEFTKDGKWASWGNMQNLDFELGYKYQVTPILDLGVTYLLYFNMSQDPRPFTSIVSNFYLSTSINF